MASTLIGTPYYMSPELFSNKPYNHKVFELSSLIVSSLFVDGSCFTIHCIVFSLVGCMGPGLLCV